MKTTPRPQSPFPGRYLAAAALVGLGAALAQPALAVPIPAITPAQSSWAVEEVVVTAAAGPLIRVAQNATASDAAPEQAAPPPRERMRDRMRERMAERRAERADIDRKLTADQVRDIVAGNLAMTGNPNLKVGKVTPKENSVVAVDIVTKTGALVTTREISTKTGRPQRLDAQGDAVGPRRGAGGRMGMRMSRGAGADLGGDLTLAPNGQRRDLKLTVDQTKKLAEARLIELGNPNLKIGAVKEKDADTITVDIVAQDNSLVVQREIDRHTGRAKRAKG